MPATRTAPWFRRLGCACFRPEVVLETASSDEELPSTPCKEGASETKARPPSKTANGSHTCPGAASTADSAGACKRVGSSATPALPVASDGEAGTRVDDSLATSGTVVAGVTYVSDNSVSLPMPGALPTCHTVKPVAPRVTDEDIKAAFASTPNCDIVTLAHCLKAFEQEVEKAVFLELYGGCEDGAHFFSLSQADWNALNSSVPPSGGPAC